MARLLKQPRLSAHLWTCFLPHVSLVQCSASALTVALVREALQFLTAAFVC